MKLGEIDKVPADILAADSFGRLVGEAEKSTGNPKIGLDRPRAVARQLQLLFGPLQCLRLIMNHGQPPGNRWAELPIEGGYPVATGGDRGKRKELRHEENRRR